MIEDRVFLILLLLSLLVSPVFASVHAANGTEIPSDNLSSFIEADPSLVSGNLPSGKVVFFYNIHCGACHEAMAFFDLFAPAHPEMTLESYDLFNSTVNTTIYGQYKEKYNRTFLQTPSVLIGNLTLEGTSDIRNHLGEVLTLQQKYREPTGFLSGLLSLLFH